MTRLVLAILAVDDAQRSAQFYVTAFGWRMTVETPVYVELALPDGFRLGVYRREGYARNTGVEPAAIPGDRVGPAELYLYTDDLLETIERVAAAGGRILSALAPRDWGDEAAYFADPDGHVVAIARPADRGTPA